MEESLTNLLADFEERIDDIQTIGNVNDDLIKIAVSDLEYIKRELQSTNRNQAIISKVDNQIGMLQQVSRLPDIAQKLPVIYEQMIVLMVGALEVYFSDVFKSISNENPMFLVWKSEKEKISFEPTLLQDGDKFTLGDVILSHLRNNGVSFQDLQSTLNAIEKYLDIKVDLENILRDKLILAAACRNIIVHNRSRIDSGFLKQIRDTKYAGKYTKRHRVVIEESYVKSVGELLKDFTRHITVLITQRDD